MSINIILLHSIGFGGLSADIGPIKWILIFIRNESNSPKRTCAHYTLSVYEYALHMYKRGILKDNAWNGWLRLIKGTFKEGTIGDYWKESEIGEWFDPDFKDFINNEVLSEGKIKAENTRH
jgi:hypothetical protein